MLTIEEIRNFVAKVAPGYPIKRIDLFGSYADGTSNEESDLDFLVEFQTPFTSLLTIASLKISLEAMMRMKIDIVPTPVSSDSFIEIKKVVPIYES